MHTRRTFRFSFGRPNEQPLRAIHESGGGYIFFDIRSKKSRPLNK